MTGLALTEEPDCRFVGWMGLRACPTVGEGCSPLCMPMREAFEPRRIAAGHKPLITLPQRVDCLESALPWLVLSSRASRLRSSVAILELLPGRPGEKGSPRRAIEKCGTGVSIVKAVSLLPSGCAASR